MSQTENRNCACSFCTHRRAIAVLRAALDGIVDDLSVPSRPAPWAAHALQAATSALEATKSYEADA